MIEGEWPASAIRMGCMYDNGDGVKFCQDAASAPAGSNVIVGAIVRLDSAGFKFVPGELVPDENGGPPTLLPGQRMTSVNGEFIPGASIRGDNGKFQFVPGLVTEAKSSGGKAVKAVFNAGQFVQTEGGDGGVEFVRGQVVHTPKGAKFVRGETVSTPDGLKFIAG